MNENVKSGDTGATARRRLIRGAFAAPAVLTLYSGSVAAATSIQCDVNTPQSGIPLVTNADDAYLRYQLWGLVPNGARGKTKYYIQGNDLKTMVRVGFTPARGNWQEFDMDTNKPTGSVVSTQPTKPACTWKRVDKYVVLRVDSAGTVVAVGDGTSGLAASDSCVSSLVGAAILR